MNNLPDEYFRVVVNPHADFMWFPDDPVTAEGEEIDSRDFTTGAIYQGPYPSLIPLMQEGSPTEFTLAAFDMPVISERLYLILNDICKNDIQFFPAKVGTCDSGYGILNVISVVNCIDESKSEFIKWTSEDGRPEKVGQYRMFAQLAINPHRVGQQKIFRLYGWEIAMIVAKEVKEAIETSKTCGVVFYPVALFS